MAPLSIIQVALDKLWQELIAVAVVVVAVVAVVAMRPMPFLVDPELIEALLSPARKSRSWRWTCSSTGFANP